MAAAGTTTQTRTCGIYASYSYVLFVILVMEATTTKIPMGLHTTTVEVGIPNTLLPVKLPRSSIVNSMVAIF